jgi:hypothetical protein
MDTVPALRAVDANYQRWLDGDTTIPTQKISRYPAADYKKRFPHPEDAMAMMVSGVSCPWSFERILLARQNQVQIAEYGDMDEQREILRPLLEFVDWIQKEVKPLAIPWTKARRARERAELAAEEAAAAEKKAQHLQSLATEDERFREFSGSAECRLELALGVSGDEFIVDKLPKNCSYEHAKAEACLRIGARNAQECKHTPPRALPGVSAPEPAKFPRRGRLGETTRRLSLPR